MAYLGVGAGIVRVVAYPVAQRHPHLPATHATVRPTRPAYPVDTNTACATTSPGQPANSTPSVASSLRYASRCDTAPCGAPCEAPSYQNTNHPAASALPSGDHPFHSRARVRRLDDQRCLIRNNNSCQRYPYPSPPGPYRTAIPYLLG